MSDTNLNLIAGEWVAEGPLIESVNPADFSALGHGHGGNAALANQAAAVARQTFEETDWAENPRARSAALLKVADALEAAKDEIADLVVAENGKIRAEAMGETMAAISEARYYAGLTRNIRGTTQEVLPGQLSLFTREAAGVAAIIVPWNAPVTLLMRSLAPALSAGCTVVVKPAAQVPLAHARIMEAMAPHLPTGVINSVNETGAEVGQALVASADIDVISFTGSASDSRAFREEDQSVSTAYNGSVALNWTRSKWT